MHSTLQAELRFSQLIKSTCRHCARNHASKTRSFHSTNRLRVPQDSPSNSNSLNGRFPTDHATDSASRGEVARGKTQEAAASYPSLPPETQTPTEKESLPSENAGKEQLNYYGSPAKRRLRNRASKEKEPEINTKLPDWFAVNNIHLFGMGPLSADEASTIDIVPGYEGGGAPKPTGVPAKPGQDANESNESHPSHSTLSEDSTSKAVTSLLQDGSPETAQDDKKYYIVADQYEEVVRTARGLLHSGQSSKRAELDEHLRNHLLLSYTGSDGAVYLDRLVETLARDLGCGIVSLDAQDISELIRVSGQPIDVAMVGRLLSYEVFSETFSDPSSTTSEMASQQSLEEDEDGQDEDEDDSLSDMNRFSDSAGPRPMPGMPFMVGRPITIALKDLLGDAPSRSSSSGGRTRLMDVFGPGSLSKNKPRMPDFTNIIDRLITTLMQFQKFSAIEISEDGEQTERAAGERRKDAVKKTGTPAHSTIIHVKDLRAIQEMHIGNQFLQMLYAGVSSYRENGANIVIVGTDTTRRVPITKQKIQDIQDGRPQEISQNVVLTPVLPNTRSKLTLHQDRKRRIATINMRHLWQMMKVRDSTIFVNLRAGFWHGNFLEELHPSDRLELEGHVWSFAYVQRLATYLTGMLATKVPSDADRNLRDQPIIGQAAAMLRNSDESKAHWATTYRKANKDDSSQPKSTDGEALMKLFRSQGGPEVDEQVVPSFDDSRLRRIRASATKYEKKLMTGIIEPKNIKTTFNDVHMPVETIDALQVLTTLSLTRPDAFKYGVLASDKIPGLLLYGPPGTGKTLAAKAVAKESGATMLEISAADINDMYVGEGEKNVKALFSLAKKLSPCVVFLDEADAIFSARSNSGRRVNHRELLNQFLKEWDGMSNDSGSAFIMVATNRPMDLDDAVLRRLPRRLLVDLPTESDRLEILKIHLRNENLASDVDLPALAKSTPFYSGSDLKNLSVAAALNAVREENRLAKQHTGTEPYQHPERRTLTGKHFETAMEEISASISEDMTSLKDIRKFDEQYGDKRGKQKKTPKLGFPTKGKQERDTIKVRE
ncbi:hypothetical protein LTR84_008806 [Exophiala bonariae]|uniref:AAA+ ATPase domain-containing protein n=1 Tax=Exophiala bonariae TaxID=1690606 RepID=A0AAV9N054_9EURO|nr:hypothetical protein LTR84_008806 [Exophiala bonariae]